MRPAHDQWLLVRWFISSATFSFPQAAGPVAFSFIALSLTGDTRGGAAMILAMTVAQVIGAIPLTRFGRKMHAATILRLLVLFRASALSLTVLLAFYEAPFIWLITFAALAGFVNGAAFGYLRSLLNHLTPASKLPRALGIAATLNELTFVLAPVAASVLSTFSPVLSLIALTIVGAIPAAIVPKAELTRIDTPGKAGGSVLSPEILLWLICAAAGGAAVAAIEIGAVALALNFDFAPAVAILFTVPLCLASVAGGVWVSVHNRMASRRNVVFFLGIMTLGSTLVAVEYSVAVTVLGTVLVGAVLAPLGTYYSLQLDLISPPEKRPEVFALLRTANALGIIFASAVLTTVSLSMALAVVTAMMLTVTISVSAVFTHRAN